MTPAELADQLSQIPDRPGQCPGCWECTSCCATHHRLLAAALRLAEAVDALASPPEDLNSIPNLIAEHSVAHLAYRAAREGLARNAP